MGNSCKKFDETTGSVSTFTRDEVAQHNQPNDCWMIIDNIIYNVSEYWKVHPGGGSYLLKYAGKDATLAFREYNHSPFAHAQLKALNAMVGTLADDGTQKTKGQAEVPEKFFLPVTPEQYKQMQEKVKSRDIEEMELLGEVTSNISQNLMFCFQCQQNVKNTGCNTIGVCGKSPTVAALQDLLIHYSKGLAQYALAHPSLEAHWNDDLYLTFSEVIFSTLTNVNFDKSRHIQDLEHVSKLRDFLRQKYEAAVPPNERDAFLTNGASPSNFVFKKDLNYLLTEARKVGLLERKRLVGDPNLFGLIEMAVYGMKGACSYFYHAEQMRRDMPTLYSADQRKVVYKLFFEVMAGLTNPQPTLQGLIDINMNVGKANLFGMEYLDKGHNDILGKPIPTDVPRVPVPGKCILVSGHDQLVLRKLLEQTEGKDVNIYTHGEMLPAFGYPGLRKFKHLVANFGTAWYNQSIEFADFPGAILMNSNCLIQPRDSYRHRLFTTHAVGWSGVNHVVDEDYSKIIECAKKEPGFEAGTPRFLKYQNIPTERCGFGHKTLCELLVPEIQNGNLKEIYVVGGCDNLDPERDFYKQIALQLPDTTVVLTLGCGKFRLTGIRDRMGFIHGTQIPRLLDIGQCNDSYSAVKTALALADLLKVGVNDLPLHLVLSWVEQKAVVILLTLLHLNIKNIVIGPTLPAFLTPTLLDFLVKTFGIQTTGANKLFAAKRDVDLMPPQISDTFTELDPIDEFKIVRPFRQYRLAKRTKLTPEISRYTVQFNNSNSTFSLQAGRHIIVRARGSDMNYVTRAYTPITRPGQKGSFDFIVKTYPNGLMCRYLESLAEGSVLEIQGYCGSTVYSAPGTLISEDRKFAVTKINMIGGGVSFVSMFQILQAVVDNGADATKLAILGAFSKQSQIILKSESEELAQKKSQQVKLQFTTSEANGRVSADLIKSLCYPADKDVITLLGGPASFRAAVVDILKSLNYNPEQIIFFY